MCFVNKDKMRDEIMCSQSQIYEYQQELFICRITYYDQMPRKNEFNINISIAFIKEASLELIENYVLIYLGFTVYKNVIFILKLENLH